MRRHSKNNCCLACLLGTGAAVWFMYYMVYSSADVDHFSMLDLYGAPLQMDRWAAIKGGSMIQTAEHAEPDDDQEEFDDTMFRRMAPPESQTFQEQGMVEEGLMNPAVVEDEEPREETRSMEISSKVKVKHPKHAHPKVEEEDQTTVGVTLSTTIVVTTSMPVTTEKAKPAHEHAKSVHDHSRTHTDHHHHGHPHEQKQVAEEIVEKTSEEPEEVISLQMVEIAPEHTVEEQNVVNVVNVTESPQEETEHTAKHGTVHTTTHQSRLHGHDHTRSHSVHRSSEHEHHHVDKSNESMASDDGVTPPIEDSNDQVEWTPEELLVKNKTGNEVEETASMEQLLALAQTGRLEERIFELKNQTFITEGRPGTTETSKLNMNETKPTNEELQSKMIQFLPDAPTKKSETVNWEKFFSFIPNGLQFCTELFPNLANQNPLPQAFQEAYIQFQKAIQPFNIKDSNIAEHLEQFIVYYFLVRAPFVKTICETGFGAGHSAFLWLYANPHVKVHMFDLGLHDYSMPIADYLSAQFPGRLNVVWGDSVNTLPMFRQANKEVTCDIVVIDGGHTFRESFADYFHLRQMVTKNNIVLLDNYPDISKNYMEILGAVWEGGKRRGEINEIFHCDYRPRPHGFSVGRFIPYTLTLNEAG